MKRSVRASAPGTRRKPGTGSISHKRARWVAELPTLQGLKHGKPLGWFDTRREAERALDAWLVANGPPPKMHTCDCTPKVPCSQAQEYVGANAWLAVLDHLERTFIVPGKPTMRMALAELKAKNAALAGKGRAA